MRGNYFVLHVIQVFIAILSKSVNSLPISASLYRSEDEDERPRSTVRMSFGNSGSTSITAHSSSKAVSSIHDVIDLHKQVKKTFSSVKNFVRSKKQQKRPIPASVGRNNAYHPYARTGHLQAGVMDHSHHNLQHSNSFNQHPTHPHLHRTSSMDPHVHSTHLQGYEMNHPNNVQHSGGGGQNRAYYSMASADPNDRSRKRQRV